jgi:hypothetical protein
MQYDKGYNGQLPPPQGYPGQSGLHQPQPQPHVVTVHAAPVYKGDHLRYDRRYRCCCGSCCHVTICVYIIGILELIGLIIGMISTISQYNTYYHNSYYYEGMVACIVSFVLGVIVIGAMFAGIYKDQPFLLIPHLVYQILTLIGFVAGIVWYCIQIASLGKTTEMSIGRGGTTTVISNDLGVAFSYVVWIVIIVVFFISMAIQIGFLVQVVKCFQYLREKRCQH